MNTKQFKKYILNGSNFFHKIVTGSYILKERDKIPINNNNSQDKIKVLVNLLKMNIFPMKLNSFINLYR